MEWCYHLYLFSAEYNNTHLAFVIDSIFCHNTRGASLGEAAGRFAGTCSQSAPFFSILLYEIIFYSATILTFAEYE